MNIVNFPGREPSPTIEDKQKEALVDVLSHMLELAQNGEIKEFVGATIDKDGDAQIHVATLDLPGAIGLYEIGKHIMITQNG